jgi:hypothetical protein
MMFQIEMHVKTVWNMGPRRAAGVAFNTVAHAFAPAALRIPFFFVPGAPVHARLIEGENGTRDLIWSRNKPQAACPPQQAIT